MGDPPEAGGAADAAPCPAAASSPARRPVASPEAGPRLRRRPPNGASVGGVGAGKGERLPPVAVRPTRVTAAYAAYAAA
eukprot:gene62-14842_t